MTIAQQAAATDSALARLSGGTLAPDPEDTCERTSPAGWATPLQVTPATIARVQALTETPHPADVVAARPSELRRDAWDAFTAWIAEHDDHRTVAADLEAAFLADRLNDFTGSLHGQLCRKGRLSDRQVDAFMRGRARAAERQQRATDVPATEAAVEEGVYERDGVVYVVKRARESGNLYAKRIVEIGGERVTEAGTVINAEFEYAPGAIRSLGREHKMDLERARELTIRYGFCIACGRHLKAAQSVMDGIGPVCRTRFA